jgi:hypothetical protein
VDADGGEVDGQAAVELHTPLDGLDELGNVGMAGVEARVGVDDADDGAGQGIFAVSQCFDEYFAQKEREMCIAVGRETLAEAAGIGRDGSRQVVVAGDTRQGPFLFLLVAHDLCTGAKLFNDEHCQHQRGCSLVIKA